MGTMRAIEAPDDRAARATAGPSRRLPRGLSLLAAVLAALFLVPMVFMFVGSIKPDARVLAEGDSWRALVPAGVTFENYSDAFERGRFGRLFVNSVIITSSIVIGSLFVNSLFGYALARLPFRGRTLVLGVVIALIIIPFQAIAIPLLFMMSQVRQLDTYQVQVLPFVANPLFVYLFYTFFLSIPKELEEAARVDGAGPATIFWRVVAPLAKPAYATVAILAFLFSWGELLWPVLVTRGPDVRPLALGIAEFQNLPPIQWGDIMAFAAMITAPVLIVFLAFQRAFVQSVARSGVKG
jgi:multiple sugar transport system permease protein